MICGSSYFLMTYLAIANQIQLTTIMEKEFFN
jgi:hypothetical protein